MKWFAAILLLAIAWALWKAARAPSKSRAKGKASPVQNRLDRSLARVQSMSDDEREYECSTDQLSCTCPDFSERRQDYPKDDARRLCKHLVQLLDKTTLREDFRQDSAVLQACRNRRRGFPLYSQRVAMTAGKATYQLFWPQHETEWIDVYERDRWGYNTLERRWAYGDKPRHAAQIATRLLGLAAIPAGSITTVSLQKDGDDYHWIATGNMDGVRLDARVNTRASWQQIAVDGDTFCSCNPHEMRWEEEDSYPNMVEAVCAWTREIIEQARLARAPERAPAAKAERTKLSAAELQARNTDRKRAVRAQGPTEEVVAALATMRALLADTLPKGVTLEGLDRSKYYVVALNGDSRRWICRLHYKTGNHYIEPNGFSPSRVENFDEINNFTEQIKKATTLALR